MTKPLLYGLYGYADNNAEATRRTLTTLTAFWDIREAGQIDGCMVVRTERKMFSELPQPLHSYYTLSDNGGEINVEPVNYEAEMRSVPYTSNKGIVTAEVMAYRIWCAITGQPIDYTLYDIPAVPNVADNPLEIAINY